MIAEARVSGTSNSQPLERGISLGSATALNMIDMIGVGPFITIPLMIGAMGGPQAMLGWILGAVFALCDGLIWAELGAAMPSAGGSYQYLKQIYGPERLGKLLSFLFVWQLSFSAPLSIASGCIGLSQYLAFLFPGAERAFLARDVGASIPLLGNLQAKIVISPATFAAIAACLAALLLLYRRITAVAFLSKWLWLGVMGTIAWIIFAGLTHFNASQAFDFPAGAFVPNSQFFTGLGAAMLIGAYDYWGYYNVCFLGGEIREPGKNIPRAIIYSIVAVAVMYIVMNISILGVIPWRELDAAAKSNTHFYVISILIQRIYGTWAARAVTILIMWASFASVFSLLLGYSRVPFAAALDGNYFKGFARVHRTGRFPTVSLAALALVASLFCFLRLADVIAALVVIRIAIQFLVQAIGLMVLRVRRPELERPFRMWLYPLPALAAMAGFIYILIVRRNFLVEVRYAAAILLSGIVIYLARAARNAEWPFLKQQPAEV